MFALHFSLNHIVGVTFTSVRFHLNFILFLKLIKFHTTLASARQGSPRG